MKPLYLLIAFAALTFSACESRQEEAREERAEAIEDKVD